MAKSIVKFILMRKKTEDIFLSVTVTGLGNFKLVELLNFKICKLLQDDVVVVTVVIVNAHSRSESYVWASNSKRSHH